VVTAIEAAGGDAEFVRANLESPDDVSGARRQLA
jgi:hypothetical protein